MSTEDSGGNASTTTDAQPSAPQTVAPQQVQQQPAPQPVQQPASSSRGSSAGQELLDAINALPERLVSAMKEAAPRPARQQGQQQQAQQNQQQQAQQQQSQPQEPGSAPAGMTRLAKWWFS